MFSYFFLWHNCELSEWFNLFAAQKYTVIKEQTEFYNLLYLISAFSIAPWGGLITSMPTCHNLAHLWIYLTYPPGRDPVDSVCWGETTPGRGLDSHHIQADQSGLFLLFSQLKASNRCEAVLATLSLHLATFQDHKYILATHWSCSWQVVSKHSGGQAHGALTLDNLHHAQAHCTVHKHSTLPWPRHIWKRCTLAQRSCSCASIGTVTQHGHDL